MPNHATKVRTPKPKQKPLREFVVWDGEGTGGITGTDKVKGTPQNYSLFGSYNGSEHDFICHEKLTTSECLEHIMTVASVNPYAIHVSFAFGYDVSMILRNMSADEFKHLKVFGYVQFEHYRIEHLPGKWFRVTEYLFNDSLKQRTRRISVQIFDVWGFFQSSFIAACQANLRDTEDTILIERTAAGKASRNNFEFSNIHFIRDYWEIENVLFHKLICKLRAMLIDAGLSIKSWHGPGAIANYAFKTNGVDRFMADCGEHIYALARYAYAGGRFERFLVGRFHGAVYGFDINSAYPTAIAQLPNLAGGTWEYVNRPTNIKRFGIYHIRLHGAPIDAPNTAPGEAWSQRPAPLFYRDDIGNISFPWRVEGWYWSPEAEQIQILSENETFRRAPEIVEGWEFTPANDLKPFAFVELAYKQRQRLKAAGDGTQMALKLMLNSLYGKMAQRAGWERMRGAPNWHQLEWAGWVTSKTRATLFALMQKMHISQIIAVETDGIYTTATPEQVGIVDSKELGGWEVTEYDEIIYLQSGVYAKRQANEWSLKYRGLDKGSLSAMDFISHSRYLVPRSNFWPAIRGHTTRFVGYVNANFRAEQNRGRFHDWLGVWETVPHKINCQNAGKRVHLHNPRGCNACYHNKTGYEQAHSTFIPPSRNPLPKGDIKPKPWALPFSTMHDIPWIDGDRSAWREREKLLEGMER